MAKTFLRWNHNTVFHVLGLLSLLVLVQNGGAFEFKVGGSSIWAVPIDPKAQNYNQWAENSRFQIGDSLLFVYPADKDVVLQVTKADYASCNTATPIQKYADGHTVFKFNQSGPFYFISGVKDNCLKNEKLVVIVLADRSNRSSTSNQAPPPPSPSPPSPPPAVEENPSSPPPGSVETIPSPAPEADHNNHPSGASSIAVSFMIGSVGGFLGSSLLLVI
ncbi:hypothetical protein U1Q18_000521 [Sarracenia purpurea var. burkii]